MKDAQSFEYSNRTGVRKEQELVIRDQIGKIKEKNLTQGKLKQNEYSARAHQVCQTCIQKMFILDGGSKFLHLFNSPLQIILISHIRKRFTLGIREVSTEGNQEKQRPRLNNLLNVYSRTLNNSSSLLLSVWKLLNSVALFSTEVFQNIL